MPTPADLAITPRNLRFGRDEVRARWWLGGNPVATAWHNSLSATFPKGETFFIETVRRFRDAVPPRLAGQIDDFVRQEAYHTREHVAFNRQVADAGYDVATIEERLDTNLGETRKGHPIAQLCITVSLEHFTAIFAHSMLLHGDNFKGASDEAQRMWTWHAIEEVEHKAVAFDTYMYLTRELKPLKRWGIRSLVFWRVSRNFVYWRSHDAVGFLMEDGMGKWEARARLFWYLVGTPGVLRRVFFNWLSYFRPGFHPWRHDDRHLLEKVESRMRLAAA